MTRRMVLLSTALVLLAAATQAPGQFIARDPGVRGGAPNTGGMIDGLTDIQKEVFKAGLEDFTEEDGILSGLGPRFNLDNCAGCHIQPAIGGTSPRVNPQVVVATLGGAKNVVPSFIRPDGPVREARFKFNADGSRDGGVHALFVVSGRRRCSASA